MQGKRGAEVKRWFPGRIVELMVKSWANLPTRCVKAPKFTEHYAEYHLPSENVGFARPVLVAGCNRPGVVGPFSGEPSLATLLSAFCSLFTPSRLLHGNEP